MKIPEAQPKADLPADTPEENTEVGTLRGGLITLMTAEEPNTKRLSGELLFAICDDNAKEFIQRTGLNRAFYMIWLKEMLARKARAKAGLPPV